MKSISNKVKVVFTFLFVFLLVIPVFAQTKSPKYADQIKKAKTIVEKLQKEKHIPGISVALGVAGEIVWSEGFGYADLENKVPVTTLTKFRIGSVSKPVTAAAMGLLIDQGKLDLDAPVQKYVPSFPKKRWKITTRQLAGHLAGIRHYRNMEFLSSKNYETVLEGLNIFQDDTLLFKPGEKYSYSSYAWNLISAVVESAAGEDFLVYMKNSVFKPLGLDHLVADHTDSIIVHRTRYYEVKDGKPINAVYVDNSYKWAGGGFLCNTEDLVKFGFAHIEPGFLKQSTLDMFFTSQKKNSGEETGYGIGWRVGADDKGRKWRAHGGGSVGGTTFLVFYPESKAVFAIVANISGARFGRLPQEIVGLFLNE